MHKLFSKIFLSFWLTLIIFTSVLMFAASSYLEHVRTQRDIGGIRTRLTQYFDQAQTVAGRQGIAGLKEWLDHLDHSEAIPIFLINEAGKDLLDREIPADVIVRLDRRRRHAERAGKESSHMHAVQLPDGSSYRMAPDFQSITLQRILQRPKVIALPIAIATLLSALACLILSRYLTFPLERLQRATRHIARGDLTQRVVPFMGNRRDEIADLAGAFDRMAARLEKVFEAQRQLLSDASHELRSPLARVQVALGLARQRCGDQAEKEFNRIELEMEHLNELIGRLLELSRLEAGVDAENTERIDIRELLEELVGDAQFEADAKGCQIALRHAFSAIVQANAMLLYSAIENVVRNAAKYTKPDTAVEISMWENVSYPDSFVIQVRDHGPGVPEEMLPHLFEPFVRVEKARDRSSGGHGLGLAIAARAIRLYGGEIMVRNELDEGLSIFIRLPRAQNQ